MKGAVVVAAGLPNGFETSSESPVLAVPTDPVRARFG
jgi:hypothetical protein